MTALCVTGDDGTILAGIPLARVSSRLTGRRLVAVPFSDVCPPAYAPQAGAAAAADLGRALADAHTQTGLNVEVRWRMQDVPGATIVDNFLVHRLELGPDADAVLARASKSQVRRALKKAEREGVVAVASTDRAGLAQFYALHEQTRRRQEVPVQPRDFILRFEELFRRGLGYVLISRHAGRPIAAAIFLTYGGTLTYKYGASDDEFLGLRPNHVLFAEAIRPRLRGRHAASSTSGAPTPRTRVSHASSGHGAPSRSSSPTPTSQSGRRSPTGPGSPTGSSRKRSAAGRRRPAV